MSTELRADCTRCCGLCCVGPAFDAVQGFGFSKPAHTPCANLDADFRCTIHGELRGRGFPSCQTFDCYGAGQRVTQRLFAGKSWKTSPELATRMFDAYRKYRSLHELLVLLDTAMTQTNASGTSGLQVLRQFIDALCESGAAASAAVNITALKNEVLKRLRLTCTYSLPDGPAAGRQSNPTGPGMRSAASTSDPPDTPGR